MIPEAARAIRRAATALGATPRRRWSASFALVASLGGMWALATPVFAAPDEPAHVVRAISVAHGELLGDEFARGHEPPNVLGAIVPRPWLSGLAVTAPDVYRHWGSIQCLAFRRQATADCLALHGSDRDTRVLTYVGRYSPGAYFVFGAAAFAYPPGAGQVYLLRLVGVLMVAALLASAVMTIRRTGASSLAGAGFAVALSPMVLFLSGTVNPSAVEIAAGAAVWVHGVALATDTSEEVDPRLVDRLGIAMCVLCLARAISPLWLALIAIVLLLVATGPRIKLLLRARRVQRWVIAVLACVVGQIVWMVHAHALDAKYLVGTPFHGSTGAILRGSVGQGFRWLREMIGVFGWLDTPAPGIVLVAWLFAIGGLVTAAIVAGSERGRRAVLGALAVAAVAPVVLQALTAPKGGFYWQGRYALPFAVGVPILAGYTLRPRAEVGAAARRRLVPLLVVALGIAQLLAFAQALRRYSVGYDGPLWFVGSARWNPPVPSLLLLGAYAVAVAVALAWIVGPRRDDADAADATVSATEA